MRTECRLLPVARFHSISTPSSSQEAAQASSFRNVTPRTTQVWPRRFFHTDPSSSNHTCSSRRSSSTSTGRCGAFGTRQQLTVRACCGPC